MNKNRMRPVLAILAMVISGALAFASGAPAAYAMPQTSCYDATGSATTTLAFMSPGAATTTLTTSNCFDRQYTLNGMYLAYQYTASSSASVLKYRIEGSFDNIDWYPEQTENAYFPVAPGTTATTSIATVPFHEYSITMSTTTDNGGSGTAARVHGIIAIPVFARYERVKFYVPTGAANGALWAELIGLREIGTR
jgi:hypothetical protein